MRQYSGLAEPNLRSQQLSLIGLLANAHANWVDRLSQHYNKPRAELLAHFDANPGALEYEIAMLINAAAARAAAELIQERERPNDESSDLFDRAVCGHWQRLRDKEFEDAASQVAELKAVMND